MNVEYTYCLPCWDWLLWIWKKTFCKRGWHLWDEVIGVGENRLYCDACGEDIDIVKPRENRLI